jgi:hypothetical protein
MTNITASITFDEDKTSTLKVYLSQQNLSLDTMLTDTLNEALDKVFSKVVPLAVQNFLSQKNGLAPQKADEPKFMKKDKKSKAIDEQEQTLGLKESVQDV